MENIQNWHLFFTHFTIGLFITSSILFLLSYLMNSWKIGEELSIVARWCLWSSAIFTIGTMVTGFSINLQGNYDALVLSMINKHRNWAIVTFISMLLFTIWSVLRYLRNKKVDLIFLFFMIIVTSFLIITTWYGNELVYRYGVGVNILSSK